jgi:hypothetical protein
MDLTVAILLAAICVVIGFLLGALIFSQRGKADPQVPPKETVSPESKAGLRIWHPRKEGDLGVELDGFTYTQQSDLTADQIQRVGHLFNELQAWLAVSPVPRPPLQQAPPESLGGSAELTGEEVERSSLNPFQIFTRSWQAGEKSESQEPEKSIVSQINEILQAKLEGTPLEDKGIRLVEDPELGMAVEVGLQRFKDIDSVPDEGVRRLIRQAVAEWESKMGD